MFQVKNSNLKLWKKLSSTWLTKISLFVIFIYCVTAIFAYLIAPDNTKEANEQISEMALHAPGTKIDLLTIRTQTEKEKQSFLSVLIKGKKSQNQYIPIIKYTQIKDTVIFDHYLGINPFTKKRLVDKTEKNNIKYFELSGEGNNAKLNILKKQYPLGSDGFGRCLLSRAIIGARISMTVGILAVIISLSIGILIGLIAGYAGGRTDDILMLIINIIWSVPTILLVFAIVLAMGRGIQIIYFAVGLTLWVDVARIVRGQVLSLKENIYIDAARSLGYNKNRILFKHILPNIMGPIWVVATGNFATAIILEAGLSYLGFGIQPPMPSWGNMLNENYGYALSGNYSLAIIPSLAIVILVLCVNIIGNALRDAYDVKID